MKNSSVIVLALFLSFAATAQEITSKINLEVGKKIVSTMNMNSDAKRQGMDMKTVMTMISDMEILEKLENGYKVKSVVRSVKMNFDGFGQSMEYDSEDPEKQDAMMAKGFEEMIGKEKIEMIDFEGKLIKDENKEEKKEGKKGPRGGGMMKMLMGGKSGGTVGANFLFLPEGIEEGKGWKVTDEDKGLRTQSIYTFNGMEGNVADIKRLTKAMGTVKQEFGGRSMSSNVDQMTSALLKVDVTTGLILSSTSELKDNSVTMVGEEEIKSEGTTKITIVNE